MAVQLISAFIGSVGFCILYHMRYKLLIPAAVGSVICWAVYLISFRFIGGIFWSSFIASAVAALYSEILAKIVKVPATILLLPAIIPMVPGSTLFYTMNCAVRGEWTQAKAYAVDTGMYALGIAAGICIIWAGWEMAFGLIRKTIRHRRKVC
ncbi:MAG: threonine/serine exporter family protein [Butyrivibrio sp.]